MDLLRLHIDYLVLLSQLISKFLYYLLKHGLLVFLEVDLLGAVVDCLLVISKLEILLVKHIFQ